jgi:hypothetical protein
MRARTSLHKNNSKNDARISLKSLECVVAEFWRVGALLRCLGAGMRSLRDSFIALRSIGVVGFFIWKPKKIPLYGRTIPSGVPLDHMQ